MLLRWTSVGELAGDEYYRLEFDRPPTTEGMVPYGDYVYLKDTEYLWEKAALAPFCERCDQWTQDVFKDLQLGWPDDPAALRHELETGNVAALGNLPSEPDRYTKVTLEACPACAQDGYLTVAGVASPTVSAEQAEEEGEEEAEMAADEEREAKPAGAGDLPES